MDTAKLLKDCFLCRELDSAELHELADIVIIRSLDKGEQLFWEGDKATGFFVLLSGSMRVYKASPEGKEFTIHQIGPGQMFAEAAIFSQGGFPANAAALTDSAVAFFPKDRFLGLIDRSPQISLKMLAGLAAFVREFNQHVENLSLKEVPARLAGFLLAEHVRADSDKIVLNTPKAELAKRLGATSETLSRNLKKLRELQIISVDGNKIALLDLPRLQSIADGEKI